MLKILGLLFTLTATTTFMTSGIGCSSTPSGTCDASCEHYLGCKNIADATTQTNCGQSCKKLNLTTAQLEKFEALNCTDAIAAIEGTRTAGTGAGGTATGGTSSDSCDRCVWDESSCIWMSPNAPVTPPCDAKCCPGH